MLKYHDYTSLARTARHGLSILELRSISIDPRVKDIIDRDTDNVCENLKWVFESEQTKFDNMEKRLEVFLSIHSTMYEEIQTGSSDEELDVNREKISQLAAYFHSIQNSTP